MKYDLLVRYMDAGRVCEERLHGVAEPSQAARVFALNNDLAASDWLACEVYAPTGELVEKLAYNGRKI